MVFCRLGIILPSNVFRKSHGTAIIYIFLIINIVVTIQGIDLLGRVHAQLTPALRIPVSLPYASVPVSFLLMTIYSISDIFHQFAKKEKAS